MNFDRVTMADGNTYQVEARCASSRSARRLARRLGLKYSFVPTRGYLVLRPTGPTGLPAEPPTTPADGGEIPFS